VTGSMWRSWVHGVLGRPWRFIWRAMDYGLCWSTGPVFQATRPATVVAEELPGFIPRVLRLIDLSATARFRRSISTASVAIELDQPLVADPEVMRDLVEHDVPDLAA
jgi:hypothetical protein